MKLKTRLEYSKPGHQFYFGLSSTNSSRHHPILNPADRLMGEIAKFTHTSSFLIDSLHWPPICKCIQSKVCSLMRNCLADSAIYFEVLNRNGVACTRIFFTDLGSF